MSKALLRVNFEFDLDTNGQDSSGAVAVTVRKPKPLLPARTLHLVPDQKSKGKEGDETAYEFAAHWDVY
jgi:hypothetical protein